VRLVTRFIKSRRVSKFEFLLNEFSSYFWIEDLSSFSFDILFSIVCRDQILTSSWRQPVRQYPSPLPLSRLSLLSRPCLRYCAASLIKWRVWGPCWTWSNKTGPLTLSLTPKKVEDWEVFKFKKKKRKNRNADANQGWTTYGEMI
jgi:hypothetical protein